MSTAEVYQIVLGCSTFFLVLPFVLIPFRRYPLGSTGAVLIGAFLMVVTTVIDQSRIYQVIGDVNNLKTIFLLWGMMVISIYFEREHLIDHVLNKFFPIGLEFHWWLVRLSIIDSLIAALFTNDVACVILTPLILKKWIEQKRDQHELNILLLALATQANIGSTLTIFGNPQMALMASKSNAFIDQHSRLELKTCVIYLWIPTFVVWSLNICFLLIYYYISRRLSTNKIDHELPIEQSSVIMTKIVSKSVNINESFIPTTPLSIRSSSSPVMINRSVSVASLVDTTLHPSTSRLFKILLCILLITVIGLLFASNDKINFDIGLVPVGAAILLFVLDTWINHQSPLLIFGRIDWNVLLLFFGLFVWLDGLNSTGIPHRLWILLNLDSASLTHLKSLMFFFIFIILGSNIFSNVPLTLLVLEQVPRTGDHLSLVLYLAFLTTIAGNLTLFGSVANLIVAQKALQSSLEYRFNFWTYLKFGLPSTLILSLVGMFIIYGLVQAMP